MAKKRKFISIINPVSNNTRSKCPKLNEGLPTFPLKCWVTPSQLYNYMNDDPIIDWLKYTHRHPNRRGSGFRRPLFTNSFKSFLMEQGNLHETYVINLIKSKGLPVTHISDIYSMAAVELTKQHILKGTPILYSAPLCNTKTNTYGIADLIVRSDFLNKIVTTPLSDDIVKNGCSLSPNYFYVIIDIKFSKLVFRSDKIHLCNNSSFPYYKGQVWLYSQALSNIQGKSPNIGLLLGRNWKVNSGCEDSNNHPLNKFGIINYDTIDEEIVIKVKKAISWRRDLKVFGHSWTCYPPSRDELYPNMCKKDYEWQEEKEKISHQIGEITQLWMCGKKHREIAFSKGISSICDLRLNSGILYISNERYSTIINKMIKINRSSDVCLPRKLTNSYFNDWRDPINNIFIDFETFSDVFFDKAISPQIFQIGLGYIHNHRWVYRYFICKKPTLEEELRIMLEFKDFIVNNFDNPKLYYWHAEEIFWKAACKRQILRGISSVISTEITSWLHEYRFRDLRKFFVNEAIVIKDCFSYSLKDISKVMRKWKLITTPFESDCNNGQLAMIRAYHCYKDYRRPLNSGIMKDIIQYNEYDCKVLYDILSYLRKKH